MSRSFEEVIASINEKNKAAAEAGKLEAEKRKFAAEEHRQWLQTPEGQQWVAAEREKQVQQRLLQEARDWNREALMIGVPSRLAPAALYGETVKETPALLYARQYVEGGDLKAGASLVLLGKASRGK